MKEQESKSSSDVMRHEIKSSSDTMGHESKSPSNMMRHKTKSSSDTIRHESNKSLSEKTRHESNKSLSEKTRHEKKSPFDTVEHKSPKHTDADRKGSAEVKPRDLLHVNTELNEVKPKGLPETHTQTEISEGSTEVEPPHIKLPKQKVNRPTKKRKELRAELYGIIERFGDVLLKWENDADNSCKLNLHHGQEEE